MICSNLHNLYRPKLVRKTVPNILKRPKLSENKSSDEKKLPKFPDLSKIELVRNFVKLIPDSKSVDINKVGNSLQVKRKVLVEILDTLEELDVLTLHSNHFVKWTNKGLKRRLETRLDAEDVCRKIRKEIAHLEDQENYIDAQIKTLQREIDDVCREEKHNMYVTFKDLAEIQNKESFQMLFKSKENAPLNAFINQECTSLKVSPSYEHVDILLLPPCDF